jgi:hypothetical protein
MEVAKWVYTSSYSGERPIIIWKMQHAFLGNFVKKGQKPFRPFRPFIGLSFFLVRSRRLKWLYALFLQNGPKKPKNPTPTIEYWNGERITYC